MMSEGQKITLEGGPRDGETIADPGTKVGDELRLRWFAPDADPRRTPRQMLRSSWELVYKRTSPTRAVFVRKYPPPPRQ